MTTITEYAVQVEMEPGIWTFVMDRTGEKIHVLATRSEAETARSIWDLGHSRVVMRQVSPKTTMWRVA